MSYPTYDIILCNIYIKVSPKGQVVIVRTQGDRSEAWPRLALGYQEATSLRGPLAPGGTDHRLFPLGLFT